MTGDVTHQLGLRPWAGRERALGALEEALAGSAADHVEIFLASRVGHHTRFAAHRVHQPQTIIECQVMVRAVAGTGSARVAVSDLRGVAGAVAAATDLARRRDGRPGAPPPHGLAPAAAARPSEHLWQHATIAWDEGARSAQAGAIMELARGAGGTAAGVLTAAITELAVVTSGGQRAYAAATEVGFSLTARVGEASSYAADLGRDASLLEVDAYAGLGSDLSLGLEGLRIGDVVAMTDQDHRFGRGYREQWTSIGVISTGSCQLFGHGPGPSTIMSGPAEAFTLVDDADANIGVLATAPAGRPS